MAEFESFGFYTISADYLEFLNSKDSEVYYNTSYRNAVKPFVGIIIDIIVEVKYNGKYKGKTNEYRKILWYQNSSCYMYSAYISSMLWLCVV